MVTISQSLYNKSFVVSQFQMFDAFKKGLVDTSLKRLNLRKDASYLMKYQEKLSTRENEVQTIDKNLVRLPFFKLKNGKNLFDLDPEEYFGINEILELNFSDIDDRLIFDHFSYLPSLILLNIQYSKILFLDKIPHYDQKFFFNLQVLELSFNNLTNQCFMLIKNIPELRFLNLTGNRINGDIPDISSLKKLEELNLSYNEIVSFFLQNDEDLIMNNDESTAGFKENKNSIDGNNSNTNDTTLKVAADSTTLRNSSLENNSNIKEKIILSEERSERNNFEDWQKKYLTNLQQFFHKLSMLPSLKILDLSNNSIGMFDINPYNIKENNLFPQLKKLDLSYNQITHNIGILLVLNIGSLAYLNITGNQFPKKKKIYDSIVDQLKANNIKLINTELKKENKVEREYSKLHTEYNVKKASFFDPSKFQKKVKNKIQLISLTLKSIL